MPASEYKVSPRLKTLIDGGLLDRLPVTFSSFCFDQIKDWDLLFPAEQNYFERLFALLDRSDSGQVDALFAPMRQIEQKMGVNERVWPKRVFTLEQVDFLNRNPHYPEWRGAVAAVFARLDPLLDAEVSRGGHARLVVVVSPSELPAAPDRMWTRIASQGRRIAVDAPDQLEDYLPLLLTGGRRAARAPSIADLWCNSRQDRAYDAWVVEAGSALASLGQGPSGPGSAAAVRLSYSQLERYRKRLMAEVNHMVKSEEIRGPRQLSARLKQMKILAGEGEFARDAILAEFARSVLLNGNGTLLINNTFVEWATVQAVRRARPSIVLAGFGIRNKVKPFSSLLIYTDQDTANPIPSQMDTLGSHVDLEVFHQYIWQDFEKYAEYRRNTAYLFVLEGADEMLVIAPPDFPLQPGSSPVTLDKLFRQLKGWVRV
jgi:hypothetical protein